MGGRSEDFNDRQTEIDAQNAVHQPYQYEAENNESWAGALPVKQSVPLSSITIAPLNYNRGLYDPGLEKDACGVGFAW